MLLNTVAFDGGVGRLTAAAATGSDRQTATNKSARCIMNLLLRWLGIFVRTEVAKRGYDVESSISSAARKANKRFLLYAAPGFTARFSRGLGVLQFVSRC